MADTNLQAAQTAIDDQRKWGSESLQDRVDHAQQAALTQIRADLDAAIASIAALTTRIGVLEKKVK